CLVRTRAARTGSLPSSRLTAYRLSLLTGGENQGQRRGLAVALHVVREGRGVRVAHEPRGRGRRPPQAGTVLPRSTAAGALREGILEARARRRKQRSDLARLVGIGAVVLDAVVLGRQLEGVHVGLGAAFLRAILHRDEVRDRDRRQDADDDD